MGPQQATRQQEEARGGKRPYAAPAIIYTTTITTRAGSPLSIDRDGANGVDPMDLFDD